MDKAVFWVGVAAVFGTLGAAAVVLGTTDKLPFNVRPSDVFMGGVALVVIALAALWWALTLNLAHGHAAKHIAEATVAANRFYGENTGTAASPLDLRDNKVNRPLWLRLLNAIYDK